MSNNQPPAATIRDVAAVVGVSPMAVSKVLHGKGSNVRVGAETAERIRAAARELRYQPNHLARSLRSRRTQTIGLVFEHFDRLGDDNAYYLQLLNGVMSVTFPAEYTLAICPKLLKVSDHGAISDGRFDGILWCKPNFTPETLEGLRHSSLPVVMMHAPPESVPGMAAYCADNETALPLAVKHLVDLGHRRIAFVVDSMNLPTVEAQARAQAFCDASKEMGVDGDILVWSYEAEALDAYRDSDRPHTAIVTFSDYHAGKILKAALDRGIRVPEDLSVIGFDSSPFCETTTPRLTSLSQPVQEMARDATLHLLALIDNGPPVPPPAPYACDLDVRDSTAPPSA
jgi:LacI family transcriptional regulator